ncbi:MAG: hypothetical protein KGQ59_02375 [Bdellovibrionales bacterium]|nr:hypothetical protein [Bdellovibrionales bacterium]
MNRVKSKATSEVQLIGRFSQESRWRALGPIDLHFHGAFGIDLMSATAEQLDRLAEQLYCKGVAGFLPTTLSASNSEIEAALGTLGTWIENKHEVGPKKGEAFPLGIHLEGPFISTACCGAHPAENLIRPSLDILKHWYKLSRGSLAKVTIAPETSDWAEIRKILQWAKKQKICVSIGHSQASADLAVRTIQSGATSVTHAWNAMPFHHRNPGLLGAALGTPNVFVEIIPDNTHVSDHVVEWTLQLHRKGVCFVSDAVPAAHSRQWSSFGPLRVRVADGAGRTQNGALAGGGSTLFETFKGYWKRRRQTSQLGSMEFVENLIHSLSEWPLQSLPSGARWRAKLRQTHIFEYKLGQNATIHPLPVSGSRAPKRIKS